VLAKADIARAAGSGSEAKAAAHAINDFAFELHRKVAADGGNVVFSPASIAIALGMARAGARGETATQMDEVLRSVASDEYANWLNALDQALAQRNGTFSDDQGDPHELTLTIANAYFSQVGLGFEPAFLEALASRFGAGMQLVDFVRDPDAARGLINEWVKEHTAERIPEVLQPGDVTPSTRLALVNTIYLKAPWAAPFNAERTKTEPFTLLDGTKVSVPMMHDSSRLICAESAGWSAAEMAYVGGRLAMLVIVPDDLEAFEAGLDADGLDEVVSTLGTREAVPVVSLPRFSIETRTELAGVLAELGMPDAIDSAAADFSGMTTEVPLFINKVVHQANIDVDEKGTEAAAATVVGMDTGGGPPDECTVNANRPFLFVLRDRETSAVLFLGRVVDPSLKP
jgi:serpin B